MGKYDIRINYVRLLQNLLVESGESKIDCTKLSDYQLITTINAYLKHHNCVQYTVKEIDEISSNMN